MASLAAIIIQHRRVIATRTTQEIQHVTKVRREDPGYFTSFIYGHVRLVLEPSVVDICWTLARFYCKQKIYFLVTFS